MKTDIVNLQNQNVKSGTPAAASGKELGKEDFMKLLLTQLSQQDPMNPQDSTAFVQQLTQFANLESINNLGTKMDSLVTIAGASNAANAVSLLGKDVRLSGNKVSGPCSIYYELPQAAQSVQVEVRDSAGKVVKIMTGQPTDAGLHETKLTDLQAGSYTFNVVAYDSAGKEMKSALSVADRVKGVSFKDNVPTLLMNSGSQMKASDVVEIRQPDQAF